MTQIYRYRHRRRNIHKFRQITKQKQHERNENKILIIEKILMQKLDKQRKITTPENLIII